MGELLLQPEAIEQRRTERAYQLAVRDLPLLRVVGFAFLSFGLFLNNRYLLGEGSHPRELPRPWFAEAAPPRAVPVPACQL